MRVAPPPSSSLATTNGLDACVQVGRQARCWGEGIAGARGRDTSWPDHEPVPIVALGDAEALRALAIGETGGCAISTAGQVRCWGQWPTKAGKEHPFGSLRVEGLDDAESVAVAGHRGCAIDAKQRLWCWEARAAVDAVGDLVAEPVEGMPPVLQLAMDAEATCVVTNAEELSCWGGKTESDAPCRGPSCHQHPTTLARDVTGLTLGELDCALVGNHQARCWHAGTEVLIALPSNTATIDTGNDRLCALDAEGALRCAPWRSCFNAELRRCTPRFHRVATGVEAMSIAKQRGVAVITTEAGTRQIVQWNLGAEANEVTPLPWRPVSEIAAARAAEVRAFEKRRDEADSLLEAAHVFIAAAATPTERKEAIEELAFAVSAGGPLDAVKPYPEVTGWAALAVAEAFARAGNCEQANATMLHAWTHGSGWSDFVLEHCPHGPTLHGVEAWLSGHLPAPEHESAVARGWHALGDPVRRDAALARAEAGIESRRSESAQTSLYDRLEWLGELVGVLRDTGATKRAVAMAERTLVEARKLDLSAHRSGLLSANGVTLAELGARDRARDVQAELEAAAKTAPSEALAALDVAEAGRIALVLGDRTAARRLAMAAESHWPAGDPQEQPSLVAVVQIWTTLGEPSRARHAWTRAYYTQDPESLLPLVVPMARRGETRDALVLLERYHKWTMFDRGVIDQVVTTLIDGGRCTDAATVVKALNQTSMAPLHLAERCPASHAWLGDYLRDRVANAMWHNTTLLDRQHYPEIEALCVMQRYADAVTALEQTQDPPGRVGALARAAVVQQHHGHPLDAAARAALRRLLTKATLPPR